MSSVYDCEKNQLYLWAATGHTFYLQCVLLQKHGKDFANFRKTHWNLRPQGEGDKCVFHILLPCLNGNNGSSIFLDCTGRNVQVY